MTKILKFLMRIFLDAYRDTKRVVNYFHLVSINGVFVIPKIYFIRLIYSFSFVRNLIKIKILNNLTFSKYFMENNIFSKNVTEIIDLKGCSEVYTLKKDLVDGVVEDIFASKFTDLINLLLSANINEDVAVFLRSINLIALLKENRDVRPIGLNLVIRKIASMVILSHASSPTTQYPNGFNSSHFEKVQFGMDKLGTEKIIHSFQYACESEPTKDKFFMDGKNSFNEMPRLIILNEVLKSFPQALPFHRKR
jgi:hypothetical protein